MPGDIPGGATDSFWNRIAVLNPNFAPRDAAGNKSRIRSSSSLSDNSSKVGTETPLECSFSATWSFSASTTKVRPSRARRLSNWEPAIASCRLNIKTGCKRQKKLQKKGRAKTGKSSDLNSAIHVQPVHHPPNPRSPICLKSNRATVVILVHKDDLRRHDLSTIQQSKNKQSNNLKHFLNASRSNHNAAPLNQEARKTEP